MQIIELSIPGAQCGACRAVVLRHLRAMPGVRFAELDLRARRAAVLVDPAAIDTTELYRRLADAGYPSTPAGVRTPADGSDDARVD